MAFRIGQGIDVHPFEKGRPLILGGVEIPGAIGLKGHSDADALTHAICDALLGALALGDLGKFFPDTDPEHKGKSSLHFLRKVHTMVEKEGWLVSNIDATIMTEEPKLAPHIEEMQRTIAKTLALEPNQVSVKATRAEKLGTIGRKEGLLAMAVVLLEH